MAWPRSCILTSFTFILLQLSSVAAQNGGKLTVGQSLRATGNGSSLLSPSGDFAFGFHQFPNNNDLFLLAIWYAKIPDTIVWYANDGNPVSQGSSVKITANEGLVLSDPQGTSLWSTTDAKKSGEAVNYGFMNDTGNFVLNSETDDAVWQSFDNPTDTLLPTQILQAGGQLHSRQSETNFTQGRFQLRLQSDGNLVLNTRDLATGYAYDPYYASNTDADGNPESAGDRVIYNKSGDLYILLKNRSRVNLTPADKLVSAQANYQRITLEFDGVLSWYYHPKSFAANKGVSWSNVKSLPDNICTTLAGVLDTGVCGYNSICSLGDGDRRPKCKCPPQYSLLDPNNRFGNCKPNFEQENCDEFGQGAIKDEYTLVQLDNVDWPLADYQQLKPCSKEECQSYCLNDCYCAVAIFNEQDQTCWKKKLPLTHGREDQGVNRIAFVKVRTNDGKLTVGQSLRATGNGSSMLSPSGDFAFGFHQFPNNNDLFLLAIWYAKIPDTIVWYANDGNPVSQGSSVKITANEGLVLSDPQGTSLWNTTDAKKSGEAVNYGFMNDTGNFVLNSETDNVVWQSFDNPTDTLLPTQILQAGGQLHSRRSETNFTQGRFQLHLQSDGNLVLNTRDLATGNAYDPYYASHTDADGNPESAGDRVIYDKSGDLYILLKNRSRVDLTPADKLVSAQTNYQRVTLEFDGVLSWYYHPKSFAANKGVSWSNVKSLPDNICTTLSGVLDTGACGYNSICSLGDGDQRPKCRCPPNYSLLDPNDTYGSCKPDFKQDNCDEYGKGAIKDEYTLVRLVNIDWPLADYAQLKPCSKEECQSNCLNDCFCAVAIFNEQDQTCLKKKLPLTHGREDSGVHRIGWLKVGNGNGSNDPINPIHQNKVIYKKNAVFTALFGSSVCINFLLLSAIVLGIYLMYNKKNPRLLDEHHRNKTLSEYSSVHCFSYKELEDATDGFREEIGRGAFGTVYKGKIGAGNSPITVAVKKLDRISKESDKEFKAEVNVIGQTHHKNLVRFIGFCKEEDQRLLVYEYMSNCTVADYLFGNLRPSWTARMQIVQGIAKGLLYLHEECSTQIIHCDIKPQNILLDDYYHARISDFGLAKLLVLNQSYTNTAVRGTKGYLAPEWFRNKPVTVKVDVYSFGVLLLETICCRRSVCMDISGEGAILTDWAFDCYQSNTLDALVNDDIEALHDKLNLERYIMVALWCIQEDPSLRPTMKRVIQMLEGVAEVASPPCPTSFTVTTQP